MSNEYKYTLYAKNNYNIFLGSNWEEKKIQEMMDKENQHKNYR